MVGVQLTEEQQAAVEAALKEERLRVMALAGTGKTTTLLSIAQSLVAEGARKVLIVAFNNSVAKELQHKVKKLGLEKHVEVRTLHGLAYRHVVGRGPVGTKADLAKAVQEKYGLDAAVAYAHVVALEKWCETDMTFAEFFSGRKMPAAKMPAAIREMIDVGLLEKVWKNPPVWTHFLYQKQFERSLKGQRVKYDAILVDEAQDLNPVQVSIVMHISASRKVLVGDPWQSIYMWRGAINTLEKLDWPVVRLTHSFRFGKNIADIANRILSLHGVELRGVGPTKDRSDIVAYISRSNSTMLSTALERGKRGEKYRFERDISNLLRLLVAAAAVWECYYTGICRGVSPLLAVIAREAESEIKMIESIRQIDEELADFMQTCKQLGVEDVAEAEEVVEEIRKGVSRSANTVLTTVHTAKGREYSRVILQDDFRIPFTGERTDLLVYCDPEELFAMGYSPPEHHWKVDWEEVNVLYVGVTRAMHSLELSTTAIKAITAVKTYAALSKLSELLCGELCELCEDEQEEEQRVQQRVRTRTAEEDEEEDKDIGNLFWRALKGSEGEMEKLLHMISDARERDKWRKRIRRLAAKAKRLQRELHEVLKEA